MNVRLDPLARLHDRKTLVKRSPLEYLDVHMACAPLIHGSFGWPIEVDGLSADERGAIVIHLVNTWLAFDLKLRAHRVNGPVCRSAANSAKLEGVADGALGPIDDVVALALRVCGGLHMANDAGGTHACKLSGRDFGDTLAGSTTRAEHGQQDQAEFNHWLRAVPLAGLARLRQQTAPCVQSSALERCALCGKSVNENLVTRCRPAISRLCPPLFVSSPSARRLL